MTIKALKKLKKKLPKNGALMIAKETGYSYEYVRLILAGKRNNPQIVKAAVKIAAEYQAELKKIKTEIEAL